MAKTKSKTKQKGKQVTEEAQFYRELASDSYSKIETGYLDLAEALFEIKKNEFYKSDYGAATFSDYCDGELGIKYGKANALVKIWEKTRDWDLDRTKLTDLGWSKARLIMSAATKDNIEDLVEAAENKCVRDLEEYIKEIRGGDKKTASGSGFSIKFKAGSSEAKVANEALDMAMGLCETKDPGVALAFIATQWMTDSGTLPEKIPLETIFALLEKTYGGKISYEEGEPEEAAFDKEEADEEPEEDESEEDYDEDEGSEEDDEDDDDEDEEDFDEDEDEEE
jgi:hypothetical protein